jgi:hypothetical protein
MACCGRCGTRRSRRTLARTRHRTRSTRSRTFLSAVHSVVRTHVHVNRQTQTHRHTHTQLFLDCNDSQKGMRACMCVLCAVCMFVLCVCAVCCVRAFGCGSAALHILTDGRTDTHLGMGFLRHMEPAGQTPSVTSQPRAVELKNSCSPPTPPHRSDELPTNCVCLMKNEFTAQVMRCVCVFAFARGVHMWRVCLCACVCGVCVCVRE